ncbi:MAG: cell wall metabolism sensor histidine kinase WalK [Elusimicrobia bacterium]|nr:cell wall metabolism sensor histidine kinase WalK [Elusimicrobiota bacterium]
MAEDIKILWFDFLKALTRSIVQINLYKPDHPQVLGAVHEVTNTLAKIFSISNELALTLDNDKLIVNNVPLLASDKLPNSIKNIFLKFNIQSITFLKGLREPDIKTFCKMQYLKTEPIKFLKENSVDKIILNTDIYAKIEKNKTAAQTNTGPQTQGTETAPGKSIAKEIEENYKIETALSVLAAKVTNDENEQKVIVNTLIKKIKNEIEKEIKNIIETHRREKKKFENDIGRTESVITSMADGVITVDKDGKILIMNSDAETMSGKTLKEVSGETIFDISNLENQIITLANEIGSEDKKDISKEVLQKGGKQLSETIKKSTTIIQNEEGKIVGAVSIPTDEAKLKQMDKLKEDFMANMTHELRSPLTSIKAALELLSKEKKITDSAKNFLTTAIRNSDRLNSLINDILDFSKLESGKMIFHLAPVSPVEIAHEAIDSMKAWAKSKEVNISQVNEEDLPEIYIDERKIIQILINIISNAIKFTPANGKIEISVDRGKENLANFVFFSVKDTGCGIKKENQTKIFEKFAQIASGEKIKGTGLGLAITKAMVVLQGGKISLESEYGKGSIFRVAIPIYTKPSESLPEVEIKKSWWRKIFGI